MKGIILAGGSGTRLNPVTQVVNKHLLPIYEKPMIYYPLSTIMQAGIRDILMITTPQDQSLYQRLLSDGSQWGINIEYAIQEKPEGIAQAFIIGESFIDNKPVCLMLGDNILYSHELKTLLPQWAQHTDGASVSAIRVDDPERYGVLKFADNKKEIVDIIEKPTTPPSSFAVTGLYFYDQTVVDIAKSLKPSKRGELEITDVNRAYLNIGKLKANIFDRGIAWLDTGTPGALLEAAQFIEVLEKRHSLKVGCPEEMAWQQGWINNEQLHALAQPLLKSGYGHYLINLLKD